MSMSKTVGVGQGSRGPSLQQKNGVRSIGTGGLGVAQEHQGQTDERSQGSRHSLMGGRVISHILEEASEGHKEFP